MFVPPELTDAIIDHLERDVPSLSACSLASRSLLPRSRVHLFRNVTLGHPRQANSCANFHRVLVDAPWMKRLVRCITINAEKGVRDIPDGSWDGDCTPMNDRVQDLLWKTAHHQQWICTDPYLPQILDALPNLQVFSANSLRWRIPATPSWESAALRKHIQTLRLDYVEFDSIPALVSVLRSLPELKVLSLGVILSTSHPMFALPDGPLLKLEELDINMEGCARVAEFIVTSSDLVDWDVLKILRVRRCYKRQIELARKLIERASHLEELEFGECVLPTNFEAQCPPLEVHRLQHLRVTITSPSSLYWWTCALTQGTEQSALASLVMLVASPDDMEEWYNMGGLLSQEKFVSLRCVKLVFKSASPLFTAGLGLVILVVGGPVPPGKG
ncbi:hypothetical protein BDZ89DRAFT_1129906 [Hymenopellis radicata]|nr:hypothetical protein BDZ89DRAFT_1129906 [Hymenopellis radicata]